MTEFEIDLAEDLVPQLHNLRVFVSVADAGSVSRAAEQLFKAPSAITRSIIELERALGVTLFERKPRGMLLDAYGEAVLVRARRIQTEIQTASENLLQASPGGQHASLSGITGMVFSGRKLQLLLLLAELRNISSAAGHMNMTQAGASMALSRMEAVLGQPLFLRRVDGMMATEAANGLLVHARRVFGELRNLRSDISALSGAIAGSVVIGTSPLGRTPIFTTALAEVVTQHPGLRVTTTESSYEQLVRGLRSGEIDFVLAVLRPPHLCLGLQTEPLFVDRLGIMVRATHPLAGRPRVEMADLLGERWIFPRQNSLGRPLLQQSFESLKLAPPVASVETGDLATIRQLLSVSDMLAVTSPFQLMNEIQAGTIVELPVTLPVATRDVGLILREGAMLSPAARCVLEAVRNQVHGGRQAMPGAPRQTGETA